MIIKYIPPIRTIYLASAVMLLVQICQIQRLNAQTQSMTLGKVHPDSLSTLWDTKDWYQKGYRHYHPRQIKKFKKLYIKQLSKIQILIFAGSWCGDTKKLLPKAMKVFKELGIQNGQIELIFLDRKKTASGFEALIKKYGITNIPTFLFFDSEGVMIPNGRFVESVKGRFERRFEEVEMDYFKNHISH